MTNIQVYDPALCCSTGVCGVDVDQGLVSFSADVDWVRQNGANVERFNLAQQPMAFAGNPLVKTLLEKSGQEGLPLILVNGQQVLAGRYPGRDELAAWAGIRLTGASVPGVSVTGENVPGESTGKERKETTLFTPEVAELVAIGAAIAANCEPCLKYHYDAAQKLGVSTQDMRSAVDLAQKVKDTPARAMLALAERYLEPKASGDAGTSPASAAPKACCGPANEPAKSAEPVKGKCC